MNDLDLALALSLQEEEDYRAQSATVIGGVPKYIAQALPRKKGLQHQYLKGDKILMSGNDAYYSDEDDKNHRPASRESHSHTRADGKPIRIGSDGFEIPDFEGLESSSSDSFERLEQEDALDWDWDTCGLPLADRTDRDQEKDESKSEQRGDQGNQEGRNQRNQQHHPQQQYQQQKQQQQKLQQHSQQQQKQPQQQRQPQISAHQQAQSQQQRPERIDRSTERAFTHGCVRVGDGADDSFEMQLSLAMHESEMENARKMEFTHLSKGLAMKLNSGIAIPSEGRVARSNEASRRLKSQKAATMERLKAKPKSTFVIVSVVSQKSGEKKELVFDNAPREHRAGKDASKRGPRHGRGTKRREILAKGGYGDDGIFDEEDATTGTTKKKGGRAAKETTLARDAALKATQDSVNIAPQKGKGKSGTGAGTFGNADEDRRGSDRSDISQDDDDDDDHDLSHSENNDDDGSEEDDGEDEDHRDVLKGDQCGEKRSGVSSTVADDATGADPASSAAAADAAAAAKGARDLFKNFLVSATHKFSTPKKQGKGGSGGGGGGGGGGSPKTFSRAFTTEGAEVFDTSLLATGTTLVLTHGEPFNPAALSPAKKGKTPTKKQDNAEDDENRASKYYLKPPITA